MTLALPEKVYRILRWTALNDEYEFLASDGEWTQDIESAKIFTSDIEVQKELSTNLQMYPGLYWYMVEQAKVNYTIDWERIAHILGNHVDRRP